MCFNTCGHSGGYRRISMLSKRLRSMLCCFVLQLWKRLVMWGLIAIKPGISATSFSKRETHREEGVLEERQLWFHSSNEERWCKRTVRSTFFVSIIKHCIFYMQYSTSQKGGRAKRFMSLLLCLKSALQLLPKWSLFIYNRWIKYLIRYLTDKIASLQRKIK